MTSRSKAIAVRVWPYLRPPFGLQVRRLILAICLAISLPRLWQPTGTYFILPRLPIGIAFAVLALAIGITCWRWRLQLYGRLVAGIGFVMFVTLAWDSWEVTKTSSLLALVTALALFGEAVTHDD